jgi:hypothetical protein
MKVSELITHLKTLDQNPEVWYVSDYPNDAIYKATVNEIRRYVLEDENGNDMPVCPLGEAP